MEEIVPLVGSGVCGPLGACHLPRLWLKMLLHATNRLPEGYRHGTGGFDEKTMRNLGIAAEDCIRFVESERPDYPRFERWVRENAANVGPEAIAKHNAIIRSVEKPAAMLPHQRAFIGLLDTTIRDAVTMNDLDDWTCVHAQVTRRAPPSLTAAGLNAALSELLRRLLVETGAVRGVAHLDLPAYGFVTSKPAADVRRGAEAWTDEPVTASIAGGGWLGIHGATGGPVQTSLAARNAVERAAGVAASMIERVGRGS